MLVLPLPLYFATLGKTQSGRVICTAGGVSSTNFVATMVGHTTLDPVDERAQRIERVGAGTASAVEHAGRHEQTGIALGLLQGRVATFAKADRLKAISVEVMAAVFH